MDLPGLGATGGTGAASQFFLPTHEQRTHHTYIVVWQRIVHHLARRIGTHLSDMVKELLVTARHLLGLVSVEQRPGGRTNRGAQKPSKACARGRRANVHEQRVNLGQFVHNLRTPEIILLGSISSVRK